MSAQDALWISSKAAGMVDCNNHGEPLSKANTSHEQVVPNSEPYLSMTTIPTLLQGVNVHMAPTNRDNTASVIGMVRVRTGVVQ